MKRSLLVAATCLATMSATAVMAADVGVSVTIGQPGFYGHIDIGDFPAPALIYPQPVVIQPVPMGVSVAPMYLRVPPGHRKHWNKHCGEYNACGRPVYFVQDSWYNNVYAPRYRERYGNEHHGDRDRDEMRGRGDEGDHGHGKGHNHGRGHDD